MHSALRSDQIYPPVEARFWEERGGEQGSDAWLAARDLLDISGSKASHSIHASDYGGASGQFLHRALPESTRPKEQPPDPAVVRAGHANEDPVAAFLLERFLPRLLGERDGTEIYGLYVPYSCVLRQPEGERFYGASPDRVVVVRGGDGKWQILQPVVCVEIKFHLGYMLLEPCVDHVIQAYVQMRVMNSRVNYLSTSCRLVFDPVDGRYMRLAKPREDPLYGTLCVRVYRLDWSDRVWAWIRERFGVFHRLLHDPALRQRCLDNPSVVDEIYLPFLYDLLQWRWFGHGRHIVDPMVGICELPEEILTQHPILVHAMRTDRLDVIERYFPPPLPWCVVVPEEGTALPYVKQQ